MELKRKKLIFLIRLLVIISISYLMLLTPVESQLKYWGYGFIVLYLASNLLISCLADDLFEGKKLFYGIVLFDCFMIVVGIYLAGMEGTDLYLVFFLIICLATLGSDLKHLIVASFVFVFVYGWLLYQQGLLLGDMAVSYCLRLPFILVIALFLGYIVEIQTRDKERRLTESEERYRNFIENLPVGTYRRTPGETSRFLMMNDAFAQLFGYRNKEEAMQESDLYGRVYVDERKKKELNQRLRRHGRVDGVSLDLLRRDGTVFHSRTWARYHAVGGEEIVEGIIIDETGLRQAEQALRESEQRLRVAGMASYDLIYEWTLQNDRLQWFGDVSRKLGDRQDGKGIPDIASWQQLIHPDDVPAFREARDRHRSSIEPIFLEYRIQHGDGSWRYWSDHSLPVLDENGLPEKWIGVCADITSRKELEAQFQQAQKMEAIGVLAGGVAHNFNNMLMEIQGQVSVMLTEQTNSEADQEALRNIDKTVKKASLLTKDLLGFARGGGYNVQLTNINELAHNEDIMFGSTKKEVIIHEDFQDDLWPVKADPGQIQQVLMNLYVNAVQAMGEAGGDIFVRTRNMVLDENLAIARGVAPGSYIQLVVEDNGCGMEEAVLQRIFDPFFTTKDSAKGTGLGLSSVYGVIKNHKGAVEVSSQKDKGTAFSVYLPALPENRIEKEKDKTAPASPGAVQGSECVLVVDDEKMVANACVRMLKKLGYSVMTAGSGEEAVSLYENHIHEVDLVLLDMLMPGMGGGETYERLKQINPRVKAVLSSGFSLNQQAREILAKGCNGFIQKPYDIEQLSAQMRNVLDADDDRKNGSPHAG